MLNDQITIPVDELHNATDVDTIYSRHSEFQNRSVYVSEVHTMAKGDTLSFYRSFPKKVGNFNGVAKLSVKISRDIEISGSDSTTTLIAPLIGEVNFSIPVGVTAADILKHRQTLVGLLDMDTIMDKLKLQLMV